MEFVIVECQLFAKSLQSRFVWQTIWLDSRVRLKFRLHKVKTIADADRLIEKQVTRE